MTDIWITEREIVIRRVLSDLKAINPGSFIYSPERLDYSILLDIKAGLYFTHDHKIVDPDLYLARPLLDDEYAAFLLKYGNVVDEIIEESKNTFWNQAGVF